MPSLNNIFKLNQNSAQVMIPQLDPQTIQTRFEVVMVNLEIQGFESAGKFSGTIEGFRTCIRSVYDQSLDSEKKKHDESKKRVNAKIAEYNNENIALSTNIENKESEISHLKQNIDDLNQEIHDAKQNPQKLIIDNSNKISFIIGVIILVFLTIYLFIFYSSASYSTFFKEFTLNTIGVASSIFDPKALPNAFQDGTTELILLLTIPFVFLGFGFLLHKLNEQKNISKYFKMATLIFTIFIFDGLLAYEITEKIYNIHKTNTFQDMPDFTISFAFQDPKFWLIIFAGFIVYIIWGFVFDFVMEIYKNLEPIRLYIREKQDKIDKAKQDIKECNDNIKNSKSKIAQNKNLIEEQELELERLSGILTCFPRILKQDCFNFLKGWQRWLAGIGSNKTDLDDAYKEVYKLLKLKNIDVIDGDIE